MQVTWNAIVNRNVQKDHNTRIWTINNNASWNGVVNQLYNRPCYDAILEKIVHYKEVLIYGTPGIGKSLFLMVLLDHIVHTANQTETEIPSVVYMKKGAGVSIDKYFLNSNGTVQKYDEASHGIPDYLLSDSVDIRDSRLSNILSLEVASDKPENYNDLLKRIAESKGLGKQIVMPLFSLEELKMIKPQLPSNNNNEQSDLISDEEAKFRYEVYGGSARKFIDMSVGTSMTMADVESTLLWMFGQNYKDSYPCSWANIISTFSDKLKPSVATEHFGIVNSTFVHYGYVGDYTCSIWASKFVEILIGSVKDKVNDNILKIMDNLFGTSGMGFVFESVGHKKLTRSVSAYRLRGLNKPNQKKKKTVDSTMKCNYPIHLIRTIEDIGSLKVGEYGLPVFTEFPLVDAVIQPDTLINFTISDTHTGAVDKLNLIRAQLMEKDLNKHKFVIVTKNDNMDNFKYMDDLSDIKQYVTTYDPITESLKKRKRNNEVTNT